MPDIPAIDLTRLNDPQAEKEIINELMQAASEVGFFNICNHGIPKEDIKTMFNLMEDFFALPAEVKETLPVDPDTYLGWERNAEISPATGCNSPATGWGKQKGKMSEGQRVLLN